MNEINRNLHNLASFLPPPSQRTDLPPLPASMYYSDPPTAADAGRGAVDFKEDSDPFDSFIYRLSDVIYNGKTKFQNVLIAETYNYGRALMLDGAIQSSADDESLYHELLVQPAMLAHHNPQDVLIIGGGEGATLREVLVHNSVRSVTMVDIDQELVELCREHLLQWHRGAFEDPRVRMIYDDGREFLVSDPARYDVVIIDVVDMLDNGPAQALYTRQFYELLKQRLRPGAVVAVQALEFSFADDKAHAALARTMRAVFPEVHSYRGHIPSFLSSWGFLLASDWSRPTEWNENDLDRTIEQKLGTQWLDHLTGEFIKGCFCLCKETRFLLSQLGPILEDGVEFVPLPDIVDIEPAFAEFPIKLA